MKSESRKQMRGLHICFFIPFFTGLAVIKSIFLGYDFSSYADIQDINYKLI